jgi:ABC-type transport system involved in cytochrome c biogenesis ATPase subunit
MESQIQEDKVKRFRVSVEGNIGAGKSTMIRHFAGFPDVDAHMVSYYTKCQQHTLSFLSLGISVEKF